MTGSASPRHPVRALILQSKLEKKGEVPHEQYQTRARSETDSATNVGDFSSPDHLMWALRLFEIFFVDYLRTYFLAISWNANIHNFCSNKDFKKKFGTIVCHIIRCAMNLKKYYRTTSFDMGAFYIKAHPMETRIFLVISSLCFRDSSDLINFGSLHRPKPPL